MPAISNIFLRILHFGRHQLCAKDLHSLHSPFVFEFYQEVVRFPYNFSLYEVLEEERNLLMNDDSIIRFEEAGAGGRGGDRKISAIASSSLMPFDKAAFLLRLCHWLKPEITIELGTSLGLTSAYLSAASGEVVTFEASSQLCHKAEALWKKRNLHNIRLIRGKIEETLPVFLSQQRGLCNLAVMDANHQYAAAVQQFQLLKAARSENACIVLDDIYWSAGMTRAWNVIRQDPEVAVSIDFFHLGLVFFRPDFPKQHYALRW